MKTKWKHTNIEDVAILFMALGEWIRSQIVRVIAKTATCLDFHVNDLEKRKINHIRRN